MRFISSIYSTSKKPTAFSFLDVQKDNKFKTMVQQKDRWTIGQLSFLKLLRAKIDETLFCSKSKKKKNVRVNFIRIKVKWRLVQNLQERGGP